MPCCHPFKRFLTGGLTENGKPDGVIMTGTAGDLLSVEYAEKRGKTVYPSAPLVRINGHTYIKDPVAVPCGSCVGCRMDRAKQWKIRVCHEMEVYPPDQVHFVTLTYRDACLPLTMDGVAYLKKSDFQEFMNRLRNPVPGVHKFFRYFACGEYGTAENGTHRPHFHLILFGVLDDLVPFAPKRFHSATVEKAWPFGISEVSPVFPETVAYVAGYVEKKQSDPYFGEYPVKPFLLMSTKPAIGSSYIPRLKNPLKDRKVYGYFGGCHSAGIPRAYLKKLENEPWFAEFKKDSQAIAQKSLAVNLAVCGTRNQEKMGDIQEAAAERALEKLRKVSL